MKRRKFLGLLGVGVATATLPALSREAVPKFSPAELSLSIDQLAEKFIEPAVEEMARKMTLDEVTREALKIAHNKLTYKSIGSTLKIRRPEKYGRSS